MFNNFNDFPLKECLVLRFNKLEFLSPSDAVSELNKRKCKHYISLANKISLCNLSKRDMKFFAILLVNESERWVSLLI